MEWNGTFLQVTNLQGTTIAKGTIAPIQVAVDAILAMGNTSALGTTTTGGVLGLPLPLVNPAPKKANLVPSEPTLHRVLMTAR